MNSFKTILFVLAMENEANPLIEQLGLQRDLDMQCNYSEFYTNSKQYPNYHLIKPKQCPYFKVESVGSETASIITYIGIQKVKPDLVLNVGSSGGVYCKEFQMQVGDICVPNQEIGFYDREMHIPIYKEYNLGRYPFSRELIDIAEQCGFIKANIQTTTSFTFTHQLELSKGVNVCEMEAAAIGKVCYLSGVQFFAIKSISDVAGNPEIQESNVDQFNKNLDNISVRLAKKVQEFVNKLSQSQSQ